MDAFVRGRGTGSGGLEAGRWDSTSPELRMGAIGDLLNRLVDANEAYRNRQPTMSDEEYDSLEGQLQELLDADDGSDPDAGRAQTFLDGVGADIPADSKWEKVRHRAPMGSLNKAQSEEAAIKWLADCQVPPQEKVVSDKADGLSCSLWYDDGELTRALTRGDGEVGEDITRNVVKMKGVRRRITGLTGECRGEIVLRRSDWQQHFPEYANPRNAAAGIAKREDGAGSEHLTVLHYQMIRSPGTGKPITRKSQEFRALEALGCATVRWKLATTFEEIRAIYEEYVASVRDSLDYDIDGLVLEFDDLATMEALGDLNKRPRGAVAWKFPHSQKATVLRSVEWQVGMSGRVTPVAHFDPVHIDGVTIKQASLATVARVRELKLWIGCNIMVSRRNMVIPYVEMNLDV